MSIEGKKEMKVIVDAMELTGLLLKKVSDSKNKGTAKAYMDCHDTVLDYLCKIYKEQTGSDLNDMTNLFMPKQHKQINKVGSRKFDIDIMDILSVLEKIKEEKPEKFESIKGELKDNDIRDYIDILLSIRESQK